MPGPTNWIGRFDSGLTGWRVVSGTAFSGQPVSGLVQAGDVVMNDAPLVPLGGDYWSGPYNVGIDPSERMIRLKGSASGILDSDVFRIETRFLVFLLGGSAQRGVGVELRVPRAYAKTPYKALDKPDADGFVAVRVATPSGRDLLSQVSWDLFEGSARGLLGSTGKVRLKVGGASKATKRLSVAKIRLQAKPAGPFRPPLWGFADLHCHPMAQLGFGGAMAGHMNGPVEDLGNCLNAHGGGHANLYRPMALANGKGACNDGSLMVPGWSVNQPGQYDQFGFKGWPLYDEILHIKTHQEWIKRSYQGGLRLMVALVVHNEMIDLISSLPPHAPPTTDRDVIEPQVQMLKEMVAHNRDWCGLARTPAEARDLIGQNKLAFVLGLETDSINDWIHYNPNNPADPNANDFSPEDTEANRAAIYAIIHEYFEYLREVGIVQVNLIHLSDNSFGGMALYDPLFIINTWHRTGEPPRSEDGYTTGVDGKAPDPKDQISKDVSLGAMTHIDLGDALQKLGYKVPQLPPRRTAPIGDRNVRAMTVAGKVALKTAMSLGMVIDIDHMSEKSVEDAHYIATTVVPDAKYPLISAHSGPRSLSPRPLLGGQPATEGYRADSESWPSEGAKSERQLRYIAETGGMFGHGTAVGELRTPDGWVWGKPPSNLLKNDCPGSSKTIAVGMTYLTEVLNDTPVAFGTDLNALLAGTAPRFGPRAAGVLMGEWSAHGDNDLDWQRDVLRERRADVECQHNGVRYKTPLADWRPERFADTSLYLDYGQGQHAQQPTHGRGNEMWQAIALHHMISDGNLDWNQTLIKASTANPKYPINQAVVDMVAGLQGVTTSSGLADFNVAGLLVAGKKTPGTPTPAARALADQLGVIESQWMAAMQSDTTALERSTFGRYREFDFNLDGLAHYGMLPDMIQDLKNVGLSPKCLTGLLGSAERYVKVWEMCDSIAARIKI
jgi:microsomal dipeptidase-like Zn-dependent dipeptidase